MRKDIKKVTGEAGVSQRDGQKSRVAGVLILQVAVFIQSLSGVFSKFASGNDFWSWSYWVPFGISLLCTFVFALLWQIALRRLSLISAFLGKSVGTVWMAFFGCLLFREVLNFGKILGLVLVIIGSALVVTDHE